MSNIKEYNKIKAFHPGYYIQEIIEDMEISQSEFATRLGTNEKTLSYLVNGQANITNDLAKKLSSMLGTSPELWLNLQSTYDKRVIEIQLAEDYERQARLCKMIDYEYFVKFAGFSKTKNIDEKIKQFCGWFKVSDLNIMLKNDFLVNYRTGISSVNEKNILNSRAWLQTAVNLSSKIETKPFDANKLKNYMNELRSMTLQEPNVFIPRMKKIFAECGVAFVLLPTLKNSGVNGAVKWINDERVVLAINNRRLDADIFWFSLFHEIKHVLQRKIKTVFISNNDAKMIEFNNKLEAEADKFASNYLIPQSDYNKFSPTQYTSDNEIIEFANSIGIHPGIVAGRLQHDKIIAQNRCSKLKVKYDLPFDYIS